MSDAKLKYVRLLFRENITTSSLARPSPLPLPVTVSHPISRTPVWWYSTLASALGSGRALPYPSPRHRPLPFAKADAEATGRGA